MSFYKMHLCEKEDKLKLETGNYVFRILISIKIVGNLFDSFNDETVDHVEIKSK